MANADSTRPLAPKEIVGTYSIFSGVNISIERGAAQDYARMIVDQLAALLQTRTLAKDCEHSTMGETNDTNSHWLACNLAEELKHLLPIVAGDKQQGVVK